MTAQSPMKRAAPNDNKPAKRGAVMESIRGTREALMATLRTRFPALTDTDFEFIATYMIEGQAAKEAETRLMKQTGESMRHMDASLAEMTWATQYGTRILSLQCRGGDNATVHPPDGNAINEIVVPAKIKCGMKKVPGQGIWTWMNTCTVSLHEYGEIRVPSQLLRVVRKKEELGVFLHDFLFASKSWILRNALRFDNWETMEQFHSGSVVTAIDTDPDGGQTGVLDLDVYLGVVVTVAEIAAAFPGVDPVEFSLLNRHVVRHPFVDLGKVKTDVWKRDSAAHCLQMETGDGEATVRPKQKTGNTQWRASGGVPSVTTHD